MLNVHPSLLPRWRGAAPVERAIMAGDELTGVSIMRLTAGLDSGPVCLQAPEAIGPTDTYGTLAERLQERGAALLIAALDTPPACSEQDRGRGHVRREADLRGPAARWRELGGRARTARARALAAHRRGGGAARRRPPRGVGGAGARRARAGARRALAERAAACPGLRAGVARAGRRATAGAARDGGRRLRARPAELTVEGVSPARACAFAVVRRVFEQDAYADRALAAEAEGLAPRERSLAMSLAYGTVQRRATLDYVAARFCSRPLPQPRAGRAGGAAARDPAAPVSRRDRRARRRPRERRAREAKHARRRRTRQRGPAARDA